MESKIDVVKSSSEIRLYAGTFPSSYKEKEILDFFGNCSAGVLRIELKTGNFAFVYMNDDKDAEAAINELNGKEIGGKLVKVELARKKEDKTNPGPRCVCVCVPTSILTTVLSLRSLIIFIIIFLRICRYDLRVKVLDLSPRTSWQDLKDWARNAGQVMFTNVFRTSDGGAYGIVEYQVLRFSN